ncbi:MAG: beta-lactamase family protein [Verrucomicrobia bacterium]|nr:beta-lactamase family protein [Verrucomicrobiota bacterium]
MKSIFASPFLALLAAALHIAAAPMQAAELPRRIAAALQPFVEQHTLAGAVALVANKDKVLSVETVGWADIAAQKPMRADNLFWIASMSKAITAAGLMVLVDDGKVQLDDAVEKYLPEFKGQMLAVETSASGVLFRKPKHPITVRNVLSHTSGLPFKSAIEQPTLDLYTLRERAVSYALTPLLFEPDSQYLYSNAGINTAGAIIEAVSGMPYAEFMEKRLLKPLGMKDTTHTPNQSQIKRLAKSYKPNKDKNGLEETTVTQLLYPLDDPRRQPMPAGGYFSTADDVAKFCQMLLNGGTLHGRRVLSENAVRAMTTVQSGDARIKNAIANYGFGLKITAADSAAPDALSPGSFSHGGAYATQMWMDARRGLAVVFMVQHAGYPADGAKKINPTVLNAAFAGSGK